MLTSGRQGAILNTVPSASALEKSESVFGGIAQLGERLNGIQEVSGSIPLISTKERAKDRNPLKHSGLRFFCFSFFALLIRNLTRLIFQRK